MLGEFTNTATTWGVSSTGQTGVFGSPSGMVGEVSDVGGWVMYIPAPHVDYSAQYWGGTVQMRNLGDGTYRLSVNGSTPTRHVYAERFAPWRFYDAQGRDIGTSEAAARRQPWGGEAAALYGQAGVPIAENAPAPSTQYTPPITSNPVTVVPTPQTPTHSPIVTTPGTPGVAPFPSGDPHGTIDELDPSVAAPWPQSPGDTIAPGGVDTAKLVKWGLIGFAVLSALK